MRMNAIKSLLICLAALLSATALPYEGLARTGSTSPTVEDQSGPHDFDFDFGAWKTHSSRLLHPLTGSTTWGDMDGITVVRKVWDGRANLAEYKADGPGGHVELLSLRWYNPAAHQWNLDFATPNGGSLGVPGVGEFKNGRGVFYDHEQYNGKYILVRFTMWGFTHEAGQSEQAFSEDGGKTWEVNWVNKYTRLPDSTEIDWDKKPSDASQPGQHDFDFNIGVWHTHINSMLDPFSSTSASIELNGKVTVQKVWGGRAELEEIEADGPNGHWEAMTLFLFNPQSHQWSQWFINSKGYFSTPLIGAFKDKRGELFSGDTFKDRAIIVRGVWSDITPNAHRYEESYSDDGGQTWHPAFRGDLTCEGMDN